MKYVIIKDDNKVLDISNKEPISVSNGVIVARCENIPPINKANGGYYEVFNIQEHTETYTEKEQKEVFKVDEATGEEYIDTEYVEVEKQRPYKTCELVGKTDEKREIRNKINYLKNKLADLDYIGVKIATGRATREEYAEQIELMNVYANEINELESRLILK